MRCFSGDLKACSQLNLSYKTGISTHIKEDTHIKVNLNSEGLYENLSNKQIILHESNRKLEKLLERIRERRKAGVLNVVDFAIKTIVARYVWKEVVCCLVLIKLDINT
ncbi:unnamed protein product [Cunninghamella echinulata]